MKICPNCNSENFDYAATCQHCGQPFPPGAVTASAQPGIATTRQQAVESAKNALIMSIIGFFCFGIILGPIAIIQARKAKTVLSPGEDGYSNAQTAEVLGWIVAALYVVSLCISVIIMITNAIMLANY